MWFCCLFVCLGGVAVRHYEHNACGLKKKEEKKLNQLHRDPKHTRDKDKDKLV